MSNCVGLADKLLRGSKIHFYMEPKKCLEPPKSMEDVVKGLHVLFEEDHVNVEQVISFLESYRSNPADWAKYANYDPHRFCLTLCGLFKLI